MTVDVLTEIVINRHRSEVAAYAGDPSNAPQWHANITSIEWRTDPPAAVDTQRTRMTLRDRGEPTGFAKVARPVMVAAMRRANQKDLATIKRILEH